MNKRQYKKFKRKLCCRKYSDYEYKKILAIVDEYIKEESKKRDIGTPMVYLLKSKKGKYIYPPKVFTNVMPISSNGFVHDGFTDPKDITFEFTCKPYIPPQAGPLGEMMKDWISELCGRKEYEVYEEPKEEGNGQNS